LEEKLEKENLFLRLKPFHAAAFAVNSIDVPGKACLAQTIFLCQFAAFPVSCSL